jgi:hypothetical protein
MLLEDIVLAVAVGVVLLVMGPPLARLLVKAMGRRRDPLAEAQERLRMAQREAEAARVNREAEKIYERLYDEALEEHAEARSAEDASTDKGNRHGHE